MPKTIALFIMLLAIRLYAAQQTADALANNKTKQILTYLASLPQQGKCPKSERLIGTLSWFAQCRKVAIRSICWLQSRHVQHNDHGRYQLADWSNTRSAQLWLGLWVEFENTAARPHRLLMQSGIEDPLESGRISGSQHASAQSSLGYWRWLQRSHEFELCRLNSIEHSHRTTLAIVSWSNGARLEWSTTSRCHRPVPSAARDERRLVLLGQSGKTPCIELFFRKSIDLSMPIFRTLRSLKTSGLTCSITSPIPRIFTIFCGSILRIKAVEIDWLITRARPMSILLHWMPIPMIQ